MELTPYADDFTARDWETPPADDAGPVRFAVVGLGWFGREEALPAIARSDYCEAAVVASGSKEKAERVAAEDGVPRGVTYDEFHAGVAADAYDAVFVATPNARHLEYVETASGLGKHVLCEKPMEADLERSAAVVKACDEAGVELMVAYRLHADPMTRRVRDLLRDGFVGDVVQIDGAFCVSQFDNFGPDHWRFDPDLAGGGALYLIGIYPLNTARFLLDADPVAVGATVVRDEARLGGMDVHSSFQLSFSDGVTASCRTSYDAHPEDCLVVLGTEGRLRVDRAFHVAPRRTLTAERDGIETEVSLQADELVEEFDYFAHALLTGRDVGPDGEHGLVDMRAMEAVYESDETGRRVDLYRSRR